MQADEDTSPAKGKKKDPVPSKLGHKFSKRPRMTCPIWLVSGAPAAVKLFDWQSVSRGTPALDLAYTLSGSLAVCDRRAWQEDLTDFCELSKWETYSLDQLQEDYRKALLWPLVWAGMLGRARRLRPRDSRPARSPETSSPWARRGICEQPWMKGALTV